MSSSKNVVRGGAIVTTVIAGILSILVGVVNSIWYGNTWMSNLVETARWVVLGVALVGLYIYLRRSSRFGWLGAVGCFLLIVGCVLNTIVYGRLVPIEKGVALVGVLMIIVGTVLFGVGILRAGSLPRAGAWLLIVSIPIFVTAIVTSTALGGAHWPNWFFIVGEVVFGSGLMVLGYGLWSHRNEPVQLVSPEQPTRVR
jgi:hypothetical protein